jgi:hypothetical protein
MNAQLRGGWGREERIPYPTGRGPYIAKIVVTGDGFHVYEDGKLRHVFAHRDPWASFSRVDVGEGWTVTRSTVGGSAGGSGAGGAGAGASAFSSLKWVLRTGDDRSGRCNWRTLSGDILFHFNPRSVIHCCIGCAASTV